MIKTFANIKEHTSFISLIISAFLHLALIILFSLGNYFHRDQSTLIDLPNFVSINLENFQGHNSGKQTQKKSAIAGIDGSKTKAATVTQDSTSLPSKTNEIDSATSGAGSPNYIASGNESGGSSGIKLSAQQKYFLEFRNLIEGKKEYPMIARVRGLEGVVVVAVTIKKSGEVYNHKIIKESAHPQLDESALKLIKRITFFKPFAEEFPEDDIELKFPISYQLNN